MASKRRKRVVSRYAIMLDEHLQRDPSNWPIVRIDDTLEGARARRQFERIRWRLPRKGYRARRIESKSLVFTPENRRLFGAIYKMTRR